MANIDDASSLSLRFGTLLRSRRKQLGMTQEDVALASGVSRRFVIELEAGRATCELGRSLLVASVVGIRPADATISNDQEMELLPELLDEGSAD